MGIFAQRACIFLKCRQRFIYINLDVFRRHAHAENTRSVCANIPLLTVNEPLRSLRNPAKLIRWPPVKLVAAATTRSMNNYNDEKNIV